jgi:glycosyltransferase involved in cell wall biosynthesis
VDRRPNMLDRICFAYYWATTGGVERVFLNRAEVLLRRYPKLAIDVFFYNDCGGVAMFTRYCRARGLSDRVRVIDVFVAGRYDSVFVVDTPQFLTDFPEAFDKVVMECHTPYAQNRTYLQEWQTRLNSLIVPSAVFLRVLEEECPGLRGKMKVVRNFIPKLPPPPKNLSLPAWHAPLFLYFAQINDHKNVAEFIEAISHVRQYLGREPLGLVCGQPEPGFPVMQMIEKNDVRGSVVVLPPVPFDSTHVLLQMLREKKSVFVSPSKGESFGLSAAEAMTAGLPVVLSDIGPHATLVGNRSKFLYPLGNAKELARKMAAAIEQYDSMSAECVELARPFAEEVFLEDWEAVFRPPARTTSGVA